MEKITKSEFVSWKNSVVTKKLFESLNSLIEEINTTILDASVISSPDAHTKIMRLLGQREGVEFILNMSVDDCDEDN